MKLTSVLKRLVKWIFILLILYHVTVSLLLASYLHVYGNSPEAYMTTGEVIESRGYPLEVHHVVTEDGYILEMKRIPGSPKCHHHDGPSGKKPVLLQHGMFSSDHVYLLNSNENALAFVLADRCFDVWLANSRGNTYSRRHITLSPDEKPFWDFSSDEMGRYDIPANIEYILEATGQEKLVFVGHSLGCTLFYIAMIEHPHLNDKIEMMFSLAPTTSVAGLSNFLVFMAPFIQPIKALLEWTGSLVYSDCQTPVQVIAASLCQQFDIFALFGGYLLFNLYGVSISYNQTTIDAMPGHYPSGGSFKTKIHFLQNFNSGQNFHRFDFGTVGNMERYGTPGPSEYDLNLVQAPVVIFAAGNDPFAPAEDIDWLASRLGNLKLLFNLATLEPMFSHGDFIWSTFATELVYDRLVAMITPAVTADYCAAPGHGETTSECRLEPTT